MQVEGKYNKCTCIVVVVEAYNMYNVCAFHVWKRVIYLFKKSIVNGQGSMYKWRVVIAVEEGVGIKEEGLLGCKERKKGIVRTEEALGLNVRGTMATTTPGNVYVLSKRRVAGY